MLVRSSSAASRYGRDLSTGRMAEMGLAAGLIATQPIGELGTQLTMRTFNGGDRYKGTVRFDGLQTVAGREVTAAGQTLVVMNRNGSINIVDDKNVVRERYSVVYGARLKVRDGQHVEKGQVLVEWDPYTFSILTEASGQVRFKDIIDKVTVHEEVDEITGMSRLIIVVSPDEKKQPAIEIVAAEAGDSNAHAKVLNRYHMPSNAHLMVGNNDMVMPGDVIAKIPRETTKTKDITGGLLRVVELVEARKPRETAVISEIDGVVRQGGIASTTNTSKSSFMAWGRPHAVMMRWVKVEDVGETEFLIDEQVERLELSAAARDHEGVDLDGFVHLGGLVPGDHTRPHGSVHLRQGGLPARPEGKRDDGPVDSGRHGLRCVSSRAHRPGRTAATAAAVTGRTGAAA